MATAYTSHENRLIIEVGKLHPDYRITLIMESPESVHPLLIVTDEKIVVGTRIFLAKHHWDIQVLDRLVVKAIKEIESRGEIE
jgi:hypothetical protein